MPYKEDGSDAPDYVKKGAEKQWAAVWNSVYAAAKKDKKSDDEAESSAYAQATGVANKPKNPKNRSLDMKVKIEPLVVEMRYAQELRAESQGDEMSIVGYAALFNAESKDLGGFRETVAPGAFTRSLKGGSDVHCLRNHDPNLILGRTKNKTLTLEQDERGLKFRCALDPNQQSHRDLHASIKRGDMDECSFAFTVGKDGQDWQEKKGNDDWYAARTLKDVDLVDVSAVTYPAYGSTSVQARCFPDGFSQEIRSAVGTLQTRLAAEKRAADDDSYEECMREVSVALAKAFPKSEGEQMYPSDGKFYVLETHEDYVIVSQWNSDNYFKIPYTEDEAAETYTFAAPQPVDKEWVPSDERSTKRLAEYRTAKDKFDKEHPVVPTPEAKKPESRSSMNAIIEQHKKDAAAAAAIAAQHNQTKVDHETAAAAIEKCMADRKKMMDEDGYEDGDWENDGDYEENALIDPKDLWSIEGESDEDRAAVLAIETRAADGKVRAKRVGGKFLAAGRFAEVGDKNDTATWKHPLHDADHVRKACGRTFADEATKAKVRKAAKKFGIEAPVPAPDADRAAREAKEQAEWRADVTRKAAALMMVGEV